MEHAQEFGHALLLLALLAEFVGAGPRAEALVPRQRIDRGADATEGPPATGTGGHPIFLLLWKAFSSASSAQNSEQKHCPVRDRQDWTRPSIMRNGSLQNAHCLGAPGCGSDDVICIMRVPR
jgi:hypothetical protein